MSRELDEGGAFDSDLLFTFLKLVRLNFEVEIVTNWELLDHLLGRETSYLGPRWNLEWNINVESHHTCLGHGEDLD